MSTNQIADTTINTSAGEFRVSTIQDVNANVFEVCTFRPGKSPIHEPIRVGTQDLAEEIHNAIVAVLAHCS